jgi:effector-binding domain-containing protein
MSRPLRAIALLAAFTFGGSQLAAAQAPAPPAASAQQSRQPYGEELSLAAKPVILLRGSANWDAAYESLVDAFKSLYAYLDKQGIGRAGPPMTIYTQADDTGFQFEAAVPIAEPPKDPPQGDMTAGQSPAASKAFKFVHHGSYDSMDATYEAITNFLDEKQLEAQELFIEEYVTDLVNTPQDKLTINVYVPVK